MVLSPQTTYTAKPRKRRISKITPSARIGNVIQIVNLGVSRADHSGEQSCRQLAFACKRRSERFIGETIESVLRQDFEDLELIMVNGASTHATHAVIERHAKQDARLSVISRA